MVLHVYKAGAINESMPVKTISTKKFFFSTWEQSKTLIVLLKIVIKSKQRGKKILDYPQLYLFCLDCLTFRVSDNHEFA